MLLSNSAGICFLAEFLQPGAYKKAQDYTQEPQPWSLNDALTHLVSALLSKGTAEPGKAPRAGAGARDNLLVFNSHNY